MKKSIFRWQIAGFIFTCVLGVILHFLFDWTGQSIFVAPFSAVNESIWEHNKLLFFPMLVFAIVENIYVGERYDKFWCIKLIGILLSILLIPTLYYTINGVFGITPDWVNIAIFFVVTAWVYIAETVYFKKNNISCRFPAFYVLIFVAVMFALFTFAPPHIPLFQDPLTQTYGFFDAFWVGVTIVDNDVVKEYNKLTAYGRGFSLPYTMTKRVYKPLLLNNSIDEVKTVLPDIKIMIMEPFVRKGPATEENWEAFDEEVKKRAAMAKKISEKHNLTYIKLQNGLDKLSKNMETTYWLVDGVHPTAMGHEYIKQEWIKAFKTLGL